MSEFQWREQLRRLGTEVAPANDLWPQIAARIAPVAVTTTRRGRMRTATSIAAAAVIAIGCVAVVYRGQRGDGAMAPFRSAATPYRTEQEPVPRTALDWAVPADPKLAAVAQNLDKASADLQAALEARPDAVFLVGMLNRTYAQRMRLMRQPAVSG